MAQNAKQQLLDLLLTKNFQPQTLDSQGKPAPTADQATVFSFDYKGESGQDYGTVVVMVTDGELTIYSGDNTGKAMEGDDKNAWFNFLQQLKNFAVGHFMSFGSQNLNKLKYSMQGQAAIKEGLFEAWSGKKDLSYNADATQARLMIKHKRNIGEGEARFRYIESLFIETAEGERYKMPFKSLSAGKAMLEHVRQGGKPYDIRGQHITTIVNEMSLLARFKRANQGKIFEGETQQLVEQATHYYETLQTNLKSLSTGRGYAKYFESWDPAAITDEDVIIEDLRHMFVEQNIDSRIEQALPLLAKLKQQDNTMKEADIFESMMNLITEGTWALPDTKEKQAALVTLLSQEVPVGADATNATEQLYDLLGDDELFDKLHALAQEDANADARNLILDRLEELKDNSAVAQVIGQLSVPQSPAADEAQPEEPAPQPPESVESPVAEEFTMESLQRDAGIITESVDRVKLDPQTGKPVAWSHEGDWEKSKNKDPRGQVTHMSDVERRKAEKVAQVNEFAPGGGEGDEDHLRKLAKQWCEAGDDYDAQEDVEDALAKFGYGISEIEDGSEAIQLVPTGEYMLDWNDNDIIVFNPEDLAEVKDPRTQTEDPPNTPQPEVTPNTLSESGMSEADILLQDIARGDVDIYNVYANPKSSIEQFISKQIHEKAEEVAREQGYNLDDDIEDILARVQRELEVEYGTDDNMDIDMGEGWKGRAVGTATGMALAPEIPGSGMIGGYIGDKIGDKISGEDEEIDELSESLAEFEAWAQELLEDDSRVTSDAPLTAPETSDSRAQSARKKKQDMLKQFAQLGDIRSEFIWASEHDVFMTKEQILDYLDQTIEDPELTALEYMHNNGYTTDGLLKGMLKSMASTGLSKADIFGIFKSAKRGNTTAGPGTISRAAKGLLRSQMTEDDEDNGPYEYKDNVSGRRLLNMPKEKAVKFAKNLMMQAQSKTASLTDSEGNTVWRFGKPADDTSTNTLFAPRNIPAPGNDSLDLSSPGDEFDSQDDEYDELTSKAQAWLDRYDISKEEVEHNLETMSEEEFADWMKSVEQQAATVDEGLDSYKHIRPTNSKVDVANQKFPEPRKATPDELRGRHSKSHVIKNGMIYHWQDPRARGDSAVSESGNSQSDAKKAYHFIRNNWMDEIELRKYAGTTKNPQAFWQAVRDYRSKDSEDRIVSSLARAFDSVYSGSNDSPWHEKESVSETTALTGQYGHSGKLEAVKPQDQDMMNRIKFLAGILK